VLFKRLKPKYGVPPSLALAVAQHESGFNSNAVGHNSNGTQDYGLMQINTINPKAFGIDGNPLDPQANVSGSPTPFSGPTLRFQRVHFC
jgi:soluble lytic murein transglycosylase-like protein